MSDTVKTGNFTADIKTGAEGFPKKEEAVATGIFNSANNVEAIIAPSVVPAIVIAWGWQTTFIIIGAIGFLWIVLWMIFNDIPQTKAVEQAYITSYADEQNEPSASVPWVKLFKYRQTWILLIGEEHTNTKPVKSPVFSRILPF